ncbi:GIY-YIG nuclease family protein [Robertkochia solimangrovi]|uniref:GIY-YIG nuclease family protein n=1 Tax=Robertkochia solimangrovi TaxID=2213046 RepID=UPI00117F36BD|nr:GIY-YIG nuclease family protein [Robertkochia solimangrovi]TRZ43260.1 GIY-YIG nuclease family protein [Robertkochia solimangrovi]
MYLYIIYSNKVDKFYVGITKNLETRLAKHNLAIYKGSFTKIANDWKYVLQYKCKTKKHANDIEKFIKRMKSRKFISKIINDPSILKTLH